MEDMPKRLMLTLLNYGAQEKNRYTAKIKSNQKPKRTIEITDSDPDGWVLLSEILLDKEINKKFGQKRLYLLFEEPILAETVEKRMKRNKTVKDSKPLEFIERQASGQRMKRKGSAYRIRRNKATWLKIAKHAIENEYYAEFLASSYNFEHPYSREATARFYTVMKGQLKEENELYHFTLDIEKKYQSNEISLSEHFSWKNRLLFLEYLRSPKKFEENVKELAKKARRDPAIINSAILLGEKHRLGEIGTTEWYRALSDLENQFLRRHVKNTLWGGDGQIGVLSYLEKHFPEAYEGFLESSNKSFWKQTDRDIKVKLSKKSRGALNQEERTQAVHTIKKIEQQLEKEKQRLSKKVKK